MSELPSQINSLQLKKLFLTNAEIHAKVDRTGNGINPTICQVKSKYTHENAMQL